MGRVREGVKGVVKPRTYLRRDVSALFHRSALFDQALHAAGRVTHNNKAMHDDVLFFYIQPPAHHEHV